MPPFDEERYMKIIDGVFENNDFKRHLQEVKSKIKDFEDELIEEVIKFHIRQMALELIKIRPWKRTIYAHCWAKITVFPHIYNQYSIYYNHKETNKLLRKYKKEINKIFKTNKNEQQN